MPLVPYYLGRPAYIWIAAMSRRSPARRAAKVADLYTASFPPSPRPASSARTASTCYDMAGETSKTPP
jgi:hypothetical protein